jgi:predicted AAA+ superfamily ATPase
MERVKLVKLGFCKNLDSQNIKTLALPNNPFFIEFKGALSEQYVIQELKTLTHLPIFYWGNALGESEIDFILQYKNEVIPLEVNSNLNTKSYSLSVYIEKYHPIMPFALLLKTMEAKKTLFYTTLFD